MLLLDLDFNDPDHWDRIIAGMPLVTPAARFTKEAAHSLLYEILMPAWSLSKSAPRRWWIFNFIACLSLEANGCRCTASGKRSCT